MGSSFRWRYVMFHDTGRPSGNLETCLLLIHRTQHSVCRETNERQIPSGNNGYNHLLDGSHAPESFESDWMIFATRSIIRGYSDVRKHDRWATWIAPGEFVHQAGIELSFSCKLNAIPSAVWLCLKPSHLNSVNRQNRGEKRNQTHPTGTQ